MSFVDSFVIAAPSPRRKACLRDVRASAADLADHGALRGVEISGAEPPEDRVIDSDRAAARNAHESVAVGCMKWSPQAARDAGLTQITADPRMGSAANPMPVDGERMTHGGFEAILDSVADEAGGDSPRTRERSAAP